MASSTVNLKWEWPAGRPLAQTLLVRVDAVESAPRGLFGVLTSPSLADALPEATDVKATVDAQSPHLPGRQVLLRLPGVEAHKLKPGDWAAFGFVVADSVCACVAPSPARSEAEARRWLGEAPCR